MQQSPRSTYVCKLSKEIYGLKQSPRAWYSRLHDRLQQLVFSSSAAGTSRFIYIQNSVTIYMLVYVDGIVIVSQLSASLPVKDLGH
jgi:hypothetical protein